MGPCEILPGDFGADKEALPDLGSDSVTCGGELLGEGDWSFMARHCQITLSHCQLFSLLTSPQGFRLQSYLDVSFRWLIRRDDPQLSCMNFTKHQVGVGDVIADP